MPSNSYNIQGWTVCVRNQVTGGADPTEMVFIDLRKPDSVRLDLIEMFGDWQCVIRQPLPDDDDRIEMKRSLNGLLGIPAEPPATQFPPTSRNMTDDEVNRVLEFFNAPTLTQIYAVVDDSYEDYAERDCGTTTYEESGPDPIQKSVAELEQRLRKQYEDDLEALDLSYFGTNNSLKVNQIRVKKKSRGRGIGSAIFKEINRWADDHHTPIVLVPQPESRKKDALNRFYKRAGFHHNRGRRRDYRLSQMFAPTMVRRPSKVVQQLTGNDD